MTEQVVLTNQAEEDLPGGSGPGQDQYGSCGTPGSMEGRGQGKA